MVFWKWENLLTNQKKLLQNSMSHRDFFSSFSLHLIHNIWQGETRTLSVRCIAQGCTWTGGTPNDRHRRGCFFVHFISTMVSQIIKLSLAFCETCYFLLAAKRWSMAHFSLQWLRIFWGWPLERASAKCHSGEGEISSDFPHRSLTAASSLPGI